MSDEPKFVILRGRPKILVDGQELGQEREPEPELATGPIARSGVFEPAGGGDLLDLAMLVSTERMTA